jgi:DNA polymerase III delta prime subunit
MSKDYLFVEKYRPRKVADCILPEKLKSTFQKFVDDKQIPNLLLSGSSGTGKTTVARAMLEEIGCDYIVINGSLNGGIDTLRNDIMNFASSVSLTGGRKYVILDEADYLTNSTQPALRNFMEEFSKNCGFILTCNYKDKIIQPLHSRCSVIDFKISKTDKDVLAKLFFKRVVDILQKEMIDFEKNAVAGVIVKFFPDWRRVLNEIQTYSATGKIDSGILANLQDVSLGQLVGFLKAKNFTSMRKWVGESDFDAVSLFRAFYDKAENYLTKESIPPLVLLISKYQYQHSFVANPDINITAFLTEVMIECSFKEE